MLAYKKQIGHTSRVRGRHHGQGWQRQRRRGGCTAFTTRREPGKEGSAIMAKSNQRVERKLAAILAADVAGYSR
jgi:hypothetical protein